MIYAILLYVLSLYAIASFYGYTLSDYLDRTIFNEDQYIQVRYLTIFTLLLAVEFALCIMIYRW
jgi:hypothetical protein